MHELDYYPLLLIFAIAWAVPLILSWFEIGKVPSVIVEIILGVVIGPFVLDLVHETPYMEFLSYTGFLFLIFLVGLEIDVNKIINSLSSLRFKASSILTNTFMLAMGIYLGTLLLSLPALWLISQFHELNVIYYALLFPTVGISITVPILKASGEIKRKFGQILLMQGSIANLLSILLISIYSGYVKNGLDIELLLFNLLFIAFLVFHAIGKKLNRVRTFQKVIYRLEHAANQIKVRGAVALFFAFVVIASAVETEPILGAFFAGLLLSLFITKDRSALLFKLDGMGYGFFIPIFFISVGINLDVSSLYNIGESYGFILLLVAAFFITQTIPALSLVRLFGFKKAFAGGNLLSARLGETVAGAQIGLSLGVLTESENAALVTASIITCLLAPMIYNSLNKKDEEHKKVLVFGGSRASLLLAERFKLHDISFMTYLQREEIIQQFDQKSLPFEKTKLTPELLKNLNILSGDLVVVLTESNFLNQQLTAYLKNELRHSKIITRRQSVTHDLVDNNFEGIKTVDHEELLAGHIEDMVLRPNAIDSLSTSFDVYRIEEISISNKQINRKLVKEIAFPQTGSLVIQKRGGEVFIPHGNTHLLIGDQITVIGNGAALAEFRRILEG
ncbi:cation:proton antiporter [uncultured Roseivirga sp.]|mgnify:CR=1 FL=1|uniref:cation:proton antiporter domain-containing protein n=1 Tax=uncultured Roseivirga sp. TaxID=543088 RepID=UPI000D7A97C1|nr:cation:proton antiporter [uncultured Roseivirga sp.]PWL28620.1 MAG: hypothetical protein DCO95_14795 [Roseivirga sp. XM-24bin3]